MKFPALFSWFYRNCSGSNNFEEEAKEVSWKCTIEPHLLFTRIFVFFRNEFWKSLTKSTRLISRSSNAVRSAAGVLDEFCKTAIQFIKAGATKNCRQYFYGAAQKLDVTKEDIQQQWRDWFIFLRKAPSFQLSETDFLDCVTPFLELDTEAKDHLKRAHIFPNLNDLRVILYRSFSLNCRTIRDLNLALGVASDKPNGTINNSAPDFLLQLHTIDGVKAKPKTVSTSRLRVNTKHLCTELESALKEAQAGHTRRGCKKHPFGPEKESFLTTSTQK